MQSPVCAWIAQASGSVVDKLLSISGRVQSAAVQWLLVVAASNETADPACPTFSMAACRN